MLQCRLRFFQCHLQTVYQIHKVLLGLWFISTLFYFPTFLHFLMLLPPCLKSYLSLWYCHYFVAVPVVYHNNKSYVVYMKGKKIACCIFSSSVHFQLFPPSQWWNCLLLNFKALISNPAASSSCWRHLQPVLPSSRSWELRQSWVYWKLAWEPPGKKMRCWFMIGVQEQEAKERNSDWVTGKLIVPKSKLSVCIWVPSIVA